MKRDGVITAAAVDDLIADGHIVLIFEDCVLKLDSWLAKHPGGRLAILHMVGKDATDEIKAYHTPATWKTMKAFRIGRKPPGVWTNKTPPIRGGIFQKQTPPPPSGASERTPTPPLGDFLASSTAAALPGTAGTGTDKDSARPVLADTADPAEDKNDDKKPKQPQGVWEVSDDPATPGKKVFVGDAAAFTDWAETQEVDRDQADYPSLDPAVQLDIQRKYEALHQRVRDEGFYNCPYLEYGKEIARYSLLFGTSMVALRHGWWMTSAFFLGLFWHQIMFSAHDAAHLAITGSFEVDSLLAMFVGDFCCGLSIGWWKSSHNVHHLITNHPEHDPDIQNVPLFATSPSFFRSIHSSYYDFTFAWDAVANVLVPFQQYTYYPVMGIARFNLYLLSWLHVLSAKSSSLGNSKAWWIRPVEILFMSCYWYIFGYLLLWRTLPTWTIRVAFVLVSHIVTMPLHVQITLSHWGMSTAELGEGESFAQRQLRTTMDVDCPAWMDFVHGGLQFQAVHHLFPRVPRHNLRRLQVLVRDFCESTKIPYTLLGFVEGNGKVLSRLEEVGEQVKHLVECQKFMAATGASGLH
ncbi:fatty acid desaturase-domain-containing protein [Staphylotrichum tortipilum]|uniref:Delta 8-(E)-sphingolipid desaturase n=1 Tax=Staphylotrichum tortipilum TaxID=2831512 RepID=A0AAN6MEX6_9PEZI|nr:fatty acid desaturase-domain-containing protein [Staphylotrichum longicolle]